MILVTWLLLTTDWVQTGDVKVQDFINISLMIVQISLAVLAIGLAVAAFAGYQGLQQVATQIAKKTAEDWVAEEYPAREHLAKMSVEGEANNENERPAGNERDRRNVNVDGGTF